MTHFANILKYCKNKEVPQSVAPVAPVAPSVAPSVAPWTIPPRNKAIDGNRVQRAHGALEGASFHDFVGFSRIFSDNYSYPLPQGCVCVQKKRHI